MSDVDKLAAVDRRSPGPLGLRPSSVIDLEPEVSDGYSYLRAYWRILRKRRWTVLTVVFVLTSLVAIISFKMQPIYEATVRVEVEAETPNIQSLSDLDRMMPTDKAFVETQVKVIQSEHLAWRTIQQLRLQENPAFAGSIKIEEREGMDRSRLEQSAAVKAFMRRLRVSRVGESRLIEVTFQNPDPVLAAEVANALVNHYTEQNFRKRYDATRQASGWMEQQLDELKAKVEKSQQALVNYERQNLIVNVSDKQSVVEQRLGDLSRELTNAQSDRLQKESLYNLVRSNESQVAFIAQNELLQRLEEKYADLKTQYVDALGQYGPNFPRVGRLRDQVNEIQSLIDRERKRIVEGIRNDYSAALGRERLLGAAVAKERAEVGRLNQLRIQHNILKREFETNQELYDNLLQRLKDATVSAGLRATNIHVVDPALPPALPVRPKKLLNIAIGLLVGLLLGVTLAFVEEGMDNSIKTVEELERVSSLPALAVIPAAASNPLNFSLAGGSKEKPSGRNGKVGLAVVAEPTSALAESYRALRTSILLSTAPRPPQVLLVTSAQPNEGKTSTCLNLAAALAQRGNKVLLVDADLRKPGIAQPLELPLERGLSTLLTGAHRLDQVLWESKSLGGLSVIGAGPQAPNPAELLSSQTMQQLVLELRQRFDHIILDSPPVIMVTDATILSAHADGVVLVVESGVTPRAAVDRAHRILEAAGARIVGGVLNKLDVRHDGYYTSYYRYFNSYYHETTRSELTSGPSDGRTSPIHSWHAPPH